VLQHPDDIFGNKISENLSNVIHILRHFIYPDDFAGNQSVWFNEAPLYTYLNCIVGRGRKTAMWATNVGNEHGQVLMSVMTVGEGASLKPMLDGLIARYRDAGVPPPKALYVDRDCCGTASVHKYFGAWPFVHVRYTVLHVLSNPTHMIHTERQCHCF
jgi:hypothetical protein